MYQVCPEGIQLCNMINRDIYWRRYKKHCTRDNDASVPFKIGTLGPHTVLPITISCPVVFSWISSMVWNLFPFKDDLIWGKARSHRCHIWAMGVLSHLGDLMFGRKHYMRRDACSGVLSWWSYQSPAALSCSLLNHLNSFHGGMFKINAKFDTDS